MLLVKAILKNFSPRYKVVEMGRIELPSAHAEEETLHAVVWLLI